MNALNRMPVNSASYCWLSIVAVTTLISATPTAQAQMPNPVNQFGRWQGIGWSDGYHACKSSGCRVWADLPPTSGNRQLANAHAVSHIIPSGRGRTFYDRFDAMNRAGQCESGPCDAADCDQCDAVRFSIDPNWTGPSDEVAFGEGGNHAMETHEYPNNRVNLPTFSGPPQPEFVTDQASGQAAEKTPVEAPTPAPPAASKSTPTPAAKPKLPAKPTRPAPPVTAPPEAKREAATEDKPALVAPLAIAKRPATEKPRRLGKSTPPVHEVATNINAKSRPTRLGCATKPSPPLVESVAIEAIDAPQPSDTGIEINAPTPKIHTNPFATSQPTTGVARRPSEPTDSSVR